MPGFFTSYVKTALANSTDDRDEPLSPRYTAANVAPYTVGRMREDCAKFQRANRLDLLGLNEEQAGKMFWLTRNGAGTGYWDMDYPEDERERLTESAESFGQYDLYVGDDGQIHGA